MLDKDIGECGVEPRIGGNELVPRFGTGFECRPEALTPLAKDYLVGREVARVMAELNARGNTQK